MAEKKVHGGVEFGTNLDDHDHAQVSQHGDHVDGQEYQEQGPLKFWIFREAQENESDFTALIFLVPVGKLRMLVQRNEKQNLDKVW